MMYLKVSNPGVAPVESFVVLGLSSSRKSPDKIGCFGSGNKMGLLLLLRQCLNPTIFLGNNQLEFFTKKKLFKDQEYDQVYYNFNGETKEAGFCSEFGEVDWNDTSMAIREIISNAIDNAPNPFDVKIDIVSETKAITDHTTVYIPLTPEVQRYYNEIDDRFLYFRRKRQLKQMILKKNKPGPAKIFRKGVFVREVGEIESLYDYNFGDQLPIDESRNLNDYDCCRCVAQTIAQDKEILTDLISRMIKNESCWELTIPHYYYGYKGWVDTWRAKLGDKAVISNSQVTAGIADRKGFKAIFVQSEAFFNALKQNGVPTVEDVVTAVEHKGNQIVDATSNAVQTLNEVWSWIKSVNLDNGKEKPSVKCFTSMMDAGSVLCGYYEKGVVYINVDNDSDKQTMMEELAHYTTGSTDLSRDFQDYAFKLATRLAQRKVN